MTLAEESVKQDLLGIMVWYVSVVGGLQYEVNTHLYYLEIIIKSNVTNEPLMKIS
jgi:hypothetical protein